MGLNTLSKANVEKLYIILAESESGKSLYNMYNFDKMIKQNSIAIWRTCTQFRFYKTLTHNTLYIILHCEIKNKNQQQQN